jgi:hypothetical protein
VVSNWRLRKSASALRPSLSRAEKLNRLFLGSTLSALGRARHRQRQLVRLFLAAQRRHAAPDQSRCAGQEPDRDEGVEDPVCNPRTMPA